MWTYNSNLSQVESDSCGKRAFDQEYKFLIKKTRFSNSFKYLSGSILLVEEKICFSPVQTYTITFAYGNDDMEAENGKVIFQVQTKSYIKSKIYMKNSLCCISW